MMLCYSTLSDSNCLKIGEKAVGICILADLHLRFAGGNYQHLKQCHVVRHISVRNHQKTKGTEAKAINWNTVYISKLCGWVHIYPSLQCLDFDFLSMDLKKSPSWAPWHQAEASTVPVGKRSTQGPKAPRPQGPKKQLGPASRPVLAAFSKNHSGAPGPSGAVLTGEVKVLLDQRGSSNGSKPWKQPRPALFWTQPATIWHIYIYCVIECVRCKNKIYIYIYESNDPTRPLCTPERCLGPGPQRSSGLLK